MRGDEDKQADIGVAVIGLGYVGLAVAIAAAEAGHSVFGIDTDADRISSVRLGDVTSDQVDQTRLARVLDRGLVLRESLTASPTCEVYILCVPTPLTDTGEPDLGPLVRATEDVAQQLKSGDMVIVESTSYPGTTQEIVQPILERSGLSALSDFDLAYSPERIDPGNRLYAMSNTPKVVAGVDERSTKRAAAFYATFCDEIVESTGIREAELSKLIENSYRNVNIAFVNELAMLAADTGIDLQEALRCAATKPFGYQVFFPSAGVGGQCIPIDPKYLSYWATNSAGVTLPTLEAAHRVNNERPLHIAEDVRLHLRDVNTTNGAPRVLIIGVAYKAHSSDVRNSPAEDLCRALRGDEIEIGFWDPLVESWSCDGQPIPRWEISESNTSRVDVAVVLQCHDASVLGGLTSRAGVVLDATHRVEGARYV